MYKHFIWDFDGTLFDSYPPMVKAYHQALDEQGIHVSEEEILLHMKISVRHLLAYSEEHYGITPSFSQRFLELRKDYEEALFEPYREAVQAIQVIRNRGGYNYVYTHRGPSTLMYLRKYDLLKYFDEVVTAENHLALKPDPEGVEYILDKHKIDRETAIIIGDRELDILSGQKAGIKACFYSERPEYTCDLADYVVTGHLDVLRLGSMDSRKKVDDE